MYRIIFRLQHSILRSYRIINRRQTKLGKYMSMSMYNSHTKCYKIILND